VSNAVLLVEDDNTLATAVRYNLERAGLVCLLAGDGPRALDLVRREKPAAVLLDLMLPGIDGLEVCRRIRSHSTVPILMLTAKADETDRVVGLEVGADDYIVKPFSMKELVARVRAALRRAQMTPDSDDAPPAPLSFSGVTIEPARRNVSRNGAPVPLKPKEYDLLWYFASHPGRVFTREQLLEQVWGYEYAGGTRTVDVHVRWLRSKVERDPAHPVHLLTSRGAGYIFELAAGN
jgi:two-component system, OmpR family, response regulator